MRRPNWRTRSRQRAQELGRKRGLASARVMRQRRMEREPDVATLLRRAQHDARGKIVREGRTYTASGVTHWQVIRSRVGQHRQYDVIVNGQLWRTGGPRRLAKWLKVPRATTIPSCLPPYVTANLPCPCLSQQ